MNQERNKMTLQYRQLVAEGALFDDKFAQQVLAKPKG